MTARTSPKKRGMGTSTNFIVALSFILPLTNLDVFAMESNPALKTMITNYSAPSATIVGWMNDKFDYRISGPKPTANTTKWISYLDVWTIGDISQLLALKRFADRHSFKSEEILLHAKYDYCSSIAQPWNQVDKFDLFEGKNGVMWSSDNVSFADLTANAYDSPTTLNKTIYIGYEEPFSEVNMVFSTTGSDVVKAWEYWSGSSWNELTVNDSTNNFTKDGRISFTPPSGWKRTILNNSRNKYFARIKFGSASRYPITKSLRGDNWLAPAFAKWQANSLNNGQYAFVVPSVLNGYVYYNTTGGTSGAVEPMWPTAVNALVVDGGITWKTSKAIRAVRGWNPTSATIVNSGELQYDPSPPMGSSAKFRYQARISTWSPNHFAMNPADSQVSALDGKTYRTSAKYFAEATIAASQNGYAGMMGDDAGVGPDADIAWAKTDFVDKTSNSWPTEALNRFRDIVDFVLSEKPDFLIGANTMAKSMGFLGNWVYIEDHDAAAQPSDPECINVSTDGKMAFDDFQPANNPKNLIGILMSRDTKTTVGSGTTVPWDRGNRGPMLALAKYYVGMNENTVFEYQSNGGWIYDLTDEVFLKNKQVKHMSVDPIPSYADVERWGKYFPAMSVNIGTPGPRDLKWIQGPQTGDGKADVWRRDFSKALVLVRTAHYLSSGDDYSNFYTPIDLGDTYYPLYADGTTGTAITTISLRAGEGAVLLKAPVGVRKNFWIPESPGNVLRMESYANAVNSGAMINYELPAIGPQSTLGWSVKLAVYNTRGELIKMLVDKTQMAGKHSVTWRAAGLSAGLYFYKLQTEEKALIKKGLLLKQ